ncbi:hypothetical protein [Pseudomonas syringae]|uniref:hypothetical protein n=1 Tax=Pseudomonas syringae TaxID=317 RepID=UPI00165DFFEF|nr:hypothetical protein [Pseudomonas syringae]QNR43487.1 hypothetical protein D5S12_20130 [Pseudomonas syringae]
MSKHPIPDWLRSQFSRIEDEVQELGPCGVFTQMRTVTQTYFEQQTEAAQPPALGDDLEDALRDLSSSACQMALNNGINEDAFLRLARSVRQLIEANKQPADQQGEPVAWLNEATGHVTTSSVVVMDWDDEKEPVQSLYRKVQPATAKVVLPERMKARPYQTVDRGSPSYVSAWNACLDEFAKLNTPQ